MASRMQFTNRQNDLMDRTAERLVVRGFRSWLAGYLTGDIQCWETAWIEFSSTLGPKHARASLTELQFWVKTLRDVTTRDLKCFPFCCPYVCRDECMALSLVSAYQRQDYKTARAAAHYLSGLNRSPELTALTEAGGSFAAALSDIGQILVPVDLDLVERIALYEDTDIPNPKAMH